jgi:hypothetical protein
MMTEKQKLQNLRTRTNNQGIHIAHAMETYWMMAAVTARNHTL